MKKYAIAGLILLFGLSASSQKLKDADVPGVVKTSFDKQYPGVNAKWEKEDGNYEAGFKKDGKTMSATYDPMGTLKETEVMIKETEMPAASLGYIKSNYGGKKVKETSKITKADGTINYEAEIEGKDVVFDGTGKFIKESKD